MAYGDVGGVEILIFCWTESDFIDYNLDINFIGINVK